MIITKLTKQQSKLTFNGRHKFHTIYDSYTVKQEYVLMDKLNYLEFVIINLSKCLLYETYFDKLQQYFGQENLQLHYTDCDSFVMSNKTQNINNYLKNLDELFKFSNLDENHQIVSHENKKVVCKLKTETPKKLWIHEFVC